MIGQQLVKLRARPSRDGRTFTYMLDYVDSDGKRRRESLGHGDKRKAEGQRSQRERELRMGIVEPQSMRLSVFTADSLARTGGQIRESTRREYEATMTNFRNVVGDKDFNEVTLRDAESYRQECLDKGNSPATVAKKLRHLKRFFQLVVERGQIDTSPLRFVKLPRSPKGRVRAYTNDECAKILKAASGFSSPIPWELLIHTAMATGMRRAELLNATWRNVNFAEMTIEVAPKGNTDETWEWHIKDAERRTLPLTNELTTMLVNHQSGQPEGHPYVFIPPERYAFIQELRRQGRWTYSDSRLRVLNNFRRDFTRILLAAGIEVGTFHDLRRTCLSGWLANGLTEYDVMQLAGHSEFSTTHRFYLVVRSDLIDRARAAGMKGSFGAQLARASISG